MTDALKHFPSPSFRKYQKEVIQKIVKDFESGVDVILLQAPTGFGKSYVNMALCSCHSPSYYTTPQLVLLDQVENDANLEGCMKVIRGRSNYPCIYEGGSTCADGPCIRKEEFECPLRGACEYTIKRGEASVSRVVSTTLAYYITAVTQHKEVSFPPHGVMFGHRKLVVIDEGHGLEDWIRKFFSLTVSNIEKKSDMTWDDVLVYVDEATKKAIERLSELHNKHILGLTVDEASEMDRVEKLVQKLNFFKADYKKHKNWIFEYKLYSGKDDIGRIELKPIMIDKYGGIVWSKGDKFIISSATILHPKLFVRSLGLEDRKWSLIDVPSSFPPENNRIVDASVGRMSFKNKNELMPRAIKVLNEILTREAGKRGIIHCQSYDNARSVMDDVEPFHKKRLMTHYSDNRGDQVEEWIRAGPDAVFVSVNMTEGLDLKDDIARFQVILKCPFPNLSDPMTKARMSMSDGQTWYDIKTIITIIQASGRATRHKDDYSTLYILDENVIRVIDKCNRFIPDWFMKSWNKRVTE